MAYPTAIGCGCLLGAGAPHLHAAQWSVQPIFSWLADFDSNRNMAFGSDSSEQGVLSADLQLARSTENTQLMLEPRFDVRRFSDSYWGPGDDRSLAGTFAWQRESASFNLNASIANQNTLTTELQETGIVNTNTRRRTETASTELDLLRTEEHLFFTQVSYLGSSYSGPAYVEFVLPGYRYESAALGERFILSDRWTLSASAFGDILHSNRAGGSSHEAGGQVGLTYTHSEKYKLDVLIGESKRSLAGETSSGTNINITGTRNFELSSLSLNYSRSLVPYGNGFLVEKQQVTAGARRSVTPYLDADVTLTRITNNAQTVQLGLDRRFYDNAVGGLSWKLSETWTLRTEASSSWAPPVGSQHTLHEWRGALTMTWRPLAKVVSR
jgi:hypothetical protein